MWTETKKKLEKSKMKSINSLNDITLVAIDSLKTGVRFTPRQFYGAWYRIAPEDCDRISTPDFERRYPHDRKYRNIIRYAIWAARKYGLIRQVRRGVWERL